MQDVHSLIAGARSRKAPSAVTRFWQWEASGILVALIVLTVALSIAADNFLSTYNMSVVARQRPLSAFLRWDRPLYFWSAELIFR